MAAPTTLRDTRVKRFSPQGVSDSLDATDEFPGACQQLANLVPDITTRNLWTCRPASVGIVSPGTTPSIVSVFKVVGDVLYGMYEDAGSGTDKPFAYNLATSSLLTMTTSGTFPTSISNITAMRRLPTMDLIGDILIITHPGYPLNSGGCKGEINISNPLAPGYGSGDLTGAITFVGLGQIPAFVVQFNQRAYYGVNVLPKPSLVASDVLLPNSVTNAGQVLTFGNNLILEIAAPLGLSNQLGGIVQSLMVFQSDSNIQQVTGDYALSTWAVNTLNVATGIVSPRAWCSTPIGLAFMSPNGMRIINQDGNVSDPIGVAGTGVVYPFTILNGDSFDSLIFAMGCDGVTIRVSFWDLLNTGDPVEYWYNIPRKTWSGPHGPITSLQLDTWNGTFLISAQPNTVTLQAIYQSDTDPGANSIFTENGTAMSFVYWTALLEDNYQMAESELVETQIMATGGEAPLTLTVQVENTANIQVTGSTVTAAATGLYPWQVSFPIPAVFNRMTMRINGTSAAFFKIGDIWMRVRTLGAITTNPT